MSLKITQRERPVTYQTLTYEAQTYRTAVRSKRRTNVQRDQGASKSLISGGKSAALPRDYLGIVSPSPFDLFCVSTLRKRFVDPVAGAALPKQSIVDIAFVFLHSYVRPYKIVIDYYLLIEDSRGHSFKTYSRCRTARGDR